MEAAQRALLEKLPLPLAQRHRLHVRYVSQESTRPQLRMNVFHAGQIHIAKMAYKTRVYLSAQTHTTLFRTVLATPYVCATKAPSF